jgi:capsular polysaccharide biosynthesis protein
MELRQYWAIFRRWVWIPLGLAVLAGGLSILLAPKPQTTYTATVRAIVSVPPEPRQPGVFAYEGYYAWVASEYLVDDLAELVKSQMFAQDVARELNDPTITSAQISGQQSTRRTHRLLSITVTGGDAAQVEKIARGIATVLDKNSARYIAQLSLGQAKIEVVDPPVVTAQVAGVRGNLDIVARTALGFAAGLAIMLLLAYLDTKVHDAAEAEKLLGLPVLGEIPREQRRAWWSPFGGIKRA